MKTCQIITSNATSQILPYYSYMTNEFQKSIGYNTGNILICDYATKKLNYDFIYSSSWDKITDEYLILAANDLRPNYYINYDYWFKFLENLQHPINLIGLGTQATLEDMNPLEYTKTLSSDMVRWIQSIADKCVSIGVRGEFTADVLKYLGIRNVDIIGCPTWFVNGYNQPVIHKKEWNNNLKPAFYTCWEPYSDWHVAWHKSLLKNMLLLENPKFIIQSEFNFLPYMIANKDIIQFLSHFTITDYTDSSNIIKKHFGLNDYDILQNNSIKNMFEIFSNIHEWEQFIKTRDFTFGFRIHGSIIALKNNVPSICIVSDSRMYELCSFLHIPFVQVNQIASSELNIEQIYKDADFSELNNQYPKLLKNYISFLEKNHISHKF